MVTELALIVRTNARSVSPVWTLICFCVLSPGKICDSGTNTVLSLFKSYELRFFLIGRLHSPATLAKHYMPYTKSEQIDLDLVMIVFNGQRVV
jgi:hypothetical protein